MFRFFNTGLRHSVTTIPSYVYHVPTHPRLLDNEDSDEKTLDVLDNKMTPLYKTPNKILTSYLWNMKFLFDFKDLGHGKRGLHSWVNFRDGQFNDFTVENRKIILDTLIKYLNNNEKEDIVVSEKINSNEYKINSSIPSNNNNIVLKKFLKSNNDIKSSETDKSVNIRFDERKSQDSVMVDNYENCTNFKRLGHEMNEKGCIAADKLDWVTALRYWTCASNLLYPPSQFNLGVYHESNNDLVSAEKWYRAAVKSGDHPTAAYNLALLLNNKKNDQLKDEITFLLHKSATQGVKEAQHCINCIQKTGYRKD